MHLYGAKLSPFVMRPVLAARAKGHELEPEPFEGGIKSPEYLALSPIGKMPLLVDDDGFALPESQAITDYLDRKLSGPSLAPSEPQAAARCRLIVRIADIYVVPHLRGLFGGRDHPDGIAPAKAGTAEGLGFIEHFRKDDDVFVVGDAFSVADAALIPLFFFYDALDRAMQTGALIADRPGLAAWWERARASELGSRCIAEQAAGLKAMRS
ncbi:glutathione S-transferase family protein [Glacieibacterium frigidum]|uniref:Glutathione S-transferase family protein n=1 Tax=Glacieibacterium frigidum TaxID=2593303 RepID=A0A552UFR5_9SPHN|nr:glutathione S-transferase family protein [Glacieibacterium frigidum]TRW17031.1 glutathione S-transferase family protein [Glacieibacterium frigidum]